MNRNLTSQQNLIAMLEKSIAAKKTNETYQAFKQQADAEWEANWKPLVEVQMTKNTPETLGDCVETEVTPSQAYQEFTFRVIDETRAIKATLTSAAKENELMEKFNTTRLEKAVDWQARENMMMTIPQSVLIN